MATVRSQQQMRLQKRKLALVREYKAAHGCRDCGETDPVVLELHHRNPATKDPRLTKRYKARATQRTGGYTYTRLSYADIASELEKCDVMCANCHRREEYQRRLEAKRVAEVESGQLSFLVAPTGKGR